MVHGHEDSSRKGAPLAARAQTDGDTANQENQRTHCCGRQSDQVRDVVPADPWRPTCVETSSACGPKRKSSVSAGPANFRLGVTGRCPSYMRTLLVAAGTGDMLGALL